MRVELDSAVLAGTRFWAAVATDDDVELVAVSAPRFVDGIREQEVLSWAGWVRERLGVTREQCAELVWMDQAVEYRPDGRIRLGWTNVKGEIQGPVWAWLVTFERGDSGGWVVAAVNDHDPGEAVAVERPRSH